MADDVWLVMLTADNPTGWCQIQKKSSRERVGGTGKPCKMLVQQQILHLKSHPTKILKLSLLTSTNNQHHHPIPIQFNITSVIICAFRWKNLLMNCILWISYGNVLILSGFLDQMDLFPKCNVCIVKNFASAHYTCMLHHKLKVPNALAKWKGIVPSAHHQQYLL